MLRIYDDLDVENALNLGSSEIEKAKVILDDIQNEYGFDRDCMTREQGEKIAIESEAIAVKLRIIYDALWMTGKFIDGVYEALNKDDMRNKV